jgi:hypothetical protein
MMGEGDAWPANGSTSRVVVPAKEAHVWPVHWLENCQASSAMNHVLQDRLTLQ